MHDVSVKTLFYVLVFSCAETFGMEQQLGTKLQKSKYSVITYDKNGQEDGHFELDNESLRAFKKNCKIVGNIFETMQDNDTTIALPNISKQRYEKMAPLLYADKIDNKTLQKIFENYLNEKPSIVDILQLLKDADYLEHTELMERASNIVLLASIVKECIISDQLDHFAALPDTLQYKLDEKLTKKIAVHQRLRPIVQDAAMVVFNTDKTKAAALYPSDKKICIWDTHDAVVYVESSFFNIIDDMTKITDMAISKKGNKLAYCYSRSSDKIILKLFDLAKQDFSNDIGYEFTTGNISNLMFHPNVNNKIILHADRGGWHFIKEPNSMQNGSVESVLDTDHETVWIKFAAEDKKKISFYANQKPWNVEKLSLPKSDKEKKWKNISLKEKLIVYGIYTGYQHLS